MADRRWISPTKRRIDRLADRDGSYACVYCHRVPEFLEELTWEHVIPVSLLGPDDDWNSVIACEGCNTEKGCRTLEEWKPGHVWGHPILDRLVAFRRGDYPRDFAPPGLRPVTPVAVRVEKPRGSRTKFRVGGLFTPEMLAQLGMDPEE